MDDVSSTAAVDRPIQEWHSFHIFHRQFDAGLSDFMVFFAFSPFTVVQKSL